MNRLSPAWLVGVVLLTGACGSDDGGAVLDGGTPVPRDASEATDGGGCAVEPNFTSIHTKILRDTRCTICHGMAPALAGGGFVFATDKTAAYTFMMGDTGAGGMPPKRVVANNSAMSSFYLKLLDPPPYGSRMPLTPDPLPDCEKEAVRMWIEGGAAND